MCLFRNLLGLFMSQCKEPETHLLINDKCNHTNKDWGIVILFFFICISPDVVEDDIEDSLPDFVQRVLAVRLRSVWDVLERLHYKLHSIWDSIHLKMVVQK